MEKCRADLNLKQVLVFQDDLIVFSSTLEEHEERLMRDLHRLKDYVLKLSLEKWIFFQSSVRNLGHVESERGMETNPEKIHAVKSWLIPRTLKEQKTILGLAGYYRLLSEVMVKSIVFNITSFAHIGLHLFTKFIFWQLIIRCKQEKN